MGTRGHHPAKGAPYTGEDGSIKENIRRRRRQVHDLTLQPNKGKGKRKTFPFLGRACWREERSGDRRLQRRQEVRQSSLLGKPRVRALISP